MVVKYFLQAVPRYDYMIIVDRYFFIFLVADSEAKLTDWMQENLYISVVAASPDMIDQLVPVMITSNAPVLNLTNNKNNQYGAEVKRCRKQLTAAAKAYQA